MKNRKNRLNMSVLLSLVGLGVPTFSFAEGPAGGGGTPSGDKGGDKGGDPAGDKGGDKGGDKSDGVDDSSDIVSKLTKEKAQLHGEAMRRKAEAAAAKKELEAFKATLPTPEELEEFRASKVKAAEEEEKRKKEAGRFEELAAKKERQHQEELKKVQEIANDRDRRWRAEKVNNLIAFELPKHTSVPVADIAPLLRDAISVDDEGAFVLKDPATGEWPINEDTGKEMTAQEFIEKFVAARPHYANHKPLGGSGSPTTGGKGGKSQGMTAKDISEMSNEEWKKRRAEVLGSIKS